MRLSFLLVCCASLFVFGVAAEATTTTTAIDATTAIEIENSNTDSDTTIIDMDRQRRRKTWDVVSLLLMMVGHGDCTVHLLDCHMFDKCEEGHTSECEKLCAMSSQHHKSHYSEFCDTGSTSSSSSASAVQSTEVDAYQENATPGNVSMDANYAAGFQLWMVAAAASVGMALVAVHMGQRKDRRSVILEDEENPGPSMTGSVGRRMVAVGGLADGVCGGASGGQQVEMSQYKLEESPIEFSPSSSFA